MKALTSVFVCISFCIFTFWVYQLDTYIYMYIQNILDTYIIYMYIQNILDTYIIYMYIQNIRTCHGIGRKDKYIKIRN